MFIVPGAHSVLWQLVIAATVAVSLCKPRAQYGRWISECVLGRCSQASCCSNQTIREFFPNHETVGITLSELSEPVDCYYLCNRETDPCWKNMNSSTVCSLCPGESWNSTCCLFSAEVLTMSSRGLPPPRDVTENLLLLLLLISSSNSSISISNISIN